MITWGATVHAHAATAGATSSSMLSPDEVHDPVGTPRSECARTRLLERDRDHVTTKRRRQACSHPQQLPGQCAHGPARPRLPIATEASMPSRSGHRRAIARSPSASFSAPRSTEHPERVAYLFGKRCVTTDMAGARDGQRLYACPPWWATPRSPTDPRRDRWRTHAGWRLRVRRCGRSDRPWPARTSAPRTTARRASRLPPATSRHHARSARRRARLRLQGDARR